MIDQLKPLIGKLTVFAKDRMGFQHPPRLFLKSDSNNSKKMLGKTAYYDPQEKAVTLFTHNRHPKDILRSYAHELVHHTQNLRGDLSPEKCGEMGDGYAQTNGHMREMEREAYEKGNMCFRDWEDTLKDKDIHMIVKISESKNLKENKSMTTKITKEFLKETIKKILSENPSMTFKKNQKGVTSTVPTNPPAATTPDPVEPGTEPAGDNLNKNQYGLPTSDAEELDEGGCGSHKRDELEEKKGKKKPGLKNPKKADLNKDGKLSSYEKKRGKAIEKSMASESKVQTPEQENTLYEQRFTPKNNRLYEKLVKQWTK